MTPRTRFTPLQRALHWSMAAAIITMLFIGVGMVSSIGPRYLNLVKTHEGLGLLILGLAIVRLIVRARSGAAPLPAELPAFAKFAAKGSHWVFYALMIGMPLVGWTMLSAAGSPIRFGSLYLPPILPVSEIWHARLWKTHVILGVAFFGLLLLHLSAALFHALIRRDNVFRSMTAGIPNEDA